MPKAGRLFAKIKNRDNNKWIFFSLGKSLGDSSGFYGIKLESPSPSPFTYFDTSILAWLGLLLARRPLRPCYWGCVVGFSLLGSRLNPMDNEPFDDKRSSSAAAAAQSRSLKSLKSIEETLARRLRPASTNGSETSFLHGTKTCAGVGCRASKQTGFWRLLRLLQEAWQQLNGKLVFASFHILIYSTASIPLAF